MHVPLPAYQQKVLRGRNEESKNAADTCKILVHVTYEQMDGKWRAQAGHFLHLLPGVFVSLHKNAARIIPNFLL